MAEASINPPENAAKSGPPKKEATTLTAHIPPTPETPPGLQPIYEALVKKAERAMSWYDVRQRGKKRGARYTRGAAILLGAVATIVPSVIAFLPDRVTWWGYE